MHRLTALALALACFACVVKIAASQQAPPVPTPNVPAGPSSPNYVGNVSLQDSAWATLIIADATSVNLTSLTVSNLYFTSPSNGTLFGAQINLYNCSVNFININAHLSGTQFNFVGGSIGDISPTSTNRVNMFGALRASSSVIFDGVSITHFSSRSNGAVLSMSSVIDQNSLLAFRNVTSNTAYTTSSNDYTSFASVYGLMNGGTLEMSTSNFTMVQYQYFRFIVLTGTMQVGGVILVRQNTIAYSTYYYDARLIATQHVYGSIHVVDNTILETASVAGTGTTYIVAPSSSLYFLYSGSLVNITNNTMKITRYTAYLTWLDAMAAGSQQVVTGNNITVAGYYCSFYGTYSSNSLLDAIKVTLTDNWVSANSANVFSWFSSAILRTASTVVISRNWINTTASTSTFVIIAKDGFERSLHDGTVVSIEDNQVIIATYQGPSLITVGSVKNQSALVIRRNVLTATPTSTFQYAGIVTMDSMTLDGQVTVDGNIITISSSMTTPLWGMKVSSQNPYQSPVRCAINISNNVFTITSAGIAYGLWIPSVNMANVTVQNNTVSVVGALSSFALSVIECPGYIPRTGFVAVFNNNLSLRLVVPSFSWQTNTGAAFSVLSSANLALACTFALVNNTIITYRPTTLVFNQAQYAVAAFNTYGATTVLVNGNTIKNVFTDTTNAGPVPDGIAFYSQPPTTAAVVYVKGNFIGGGWESTATVGFVNVGINADLLGNSMYGMWVFERNFVNGVKFFNNTMTTTRSNLPTITSTCDYLNGQTLLSVANGSVGTCSNSAPVPPAPTGAVVAPTPVPAWIPSPAPTPVPPTLNPSTPPPVDIDVIGAVTRSGFADTTFVISNATNVDLSDCTITTLYFLGTVAGANINVRNCTITSIVINAPVSQMSSIRFTGCRISTSFQAYGVISNSTVTFEYITMPALSITSGSAFGFRNFIQDGSMVTFNNINASCSYSAGDGFISLHGVMSSNVLFSDTWLRYTTSAYTYFTFAFRVVSPVAWSSITIRNVTLPYFVTYNQYSYTFLRFDSPIASSQIAVVNTAVNVTVGWSTMTFMTLGAVAGAGAVVNVSSNNWVVTAGNTYAVMAGLISDYAAVIFSGNQLQLTRTSNSYDYAYVVSSTVNQATVLISNNVITSKPAATPFYTIMLLNAGPWTNYTSIQITNNVVDVPQQNPTLVDSSYSYVSIDGYYGRYGMLNSTFNFSGNLIKNSYHRVESIYVNIASGAGNSAVVFSGNNFTLESLSDPLYFVPYYSTMLQFSPIFSPQMSVVVTDNTLTGVSGNTAFRFVNTYVISQNRPSYISLATVSGIAAAFTFSGNVINCTATESNSGVSAALTGTYIVARNVTIANNRITINCKVPGCVGLNVPDAAWPQGTISVIGNTVTVDMTKPLNAVGTANGLALSLPNVMEYYGSGRIIVITDNSFTTRRAAVRSPNQPLFAAAKINVQSTGLLRIERNAFVSWMEPTLYQPDGVQFDGTSASAPSFTSVISQNVLTNTYMNGTATVLTVAFNAPTAVMSGPYSFSNNVANAMVFFNTTSQTVLSYPVRSTCDYLNGQLLTAINNGTVGACSAPVPALPPFPVGPVFVPTPVPPWMPTPPPTPAPPTLSPRAPSVDVSGSVTRSGFTASQYTVDSPVAVALSDCSITTLYFTGSVVGANIAITNCNVTTLIFNAHLQQQSSFLFTGGWLGTTSTSNSGGWFYGSVTDASSVTFRQTAVTSTYSSSKSFGLQFLGAVEQGATVTLDTVSFTGTMSSSADHSGAVSLWSVDTNARVSIVNCLIVMNSYYYARVVVVQGAVQNNAVLSIRNNNITVNHQYQYSYDSSVVETNLVLSGGVVDLSSNWVESTTAIYYSSNTMVVVKLVTLAGATSVVNVSSNVMSLGRYNVYMIQATQPVANASVILEANQITLLDNTYTAYGIYFNYGVSGTTVSASRNVVKAAQTNVNMYATYLLYWPGGASWATAQVNDNVVTVYGQLSLLITGLMSGTSPLTVSLVSSAVTVSRNTVGVARQSVSCPTCYQYQLGGNLVQITAMASNASVVTVTNNVVQHNVTASFMLFYGSGSYMNASVLTIASNVIELTYVASQSWYYGIQIGSDSNYYNVNQQATIAGTIVIESNQFLLLQSSVPCGDYRPFLAGLRSVHVNSHRGEYYSRGGGL
jgi:hypothetical protein